MAVILSARLQAIADLVPQGARVADVGTDHALLPICLIQTKAARSAIATDIAVLPAELAAANVRAHGLTKVIDVRVGPGLQTVHAGEVDTVTIAGMGGGTIRDVLAESADVLTHVQRLIVQPMNLGQHVRSFLLDSAWALIAERTVVDHGRVYEVIAASPSTPAEALAGYNGFTDDEVAMTVALQLGPTQLQHPTPEFLTRVKQTMLHWRERQQRMRQSRRDDVFQRAVHLGRQIAWLETWYKGQAQNEGTDTHADCTRRD